MQVYVEKQKCTGCSHCHDVCPVAVFAMKDRSAADVNGDVAPEDSKWKGTSDPAVVSKWGNVQDGHNHFADKNDGASGGISVAVNGPSCIFCQACLVQCEGECIVITDDTGAVYHSVYE
ncbi:MAG: 4Fe-4S dicluster domain-containing protein [Candidatus Marsarchaeota archaeon]|jgi:Fe-S-cluster-containing hydrogenase component 2|nr:4Fe-4S dicluster domain-containing protein [Candidatus Marsarchaeota archaeon]